MEICFVSLRSHISGSGLGIGVGDGDGPPALQRAERQVDAACLAARCGFAARTAVFQRGFNEGGDVAFAFCGG